MLQQQWEKMSILRAGGIIVKITAGKILEKDIVLENAKTLSKFSLDIPICIEPVKEKIQEIFEEHIIFAKGLQKLSKIVKEILPVPRAVLETCIYFYEKFGDILLFDVGGATTHVHSVTIGSPSIREISINVELLAKRTVEGDLGVYRNLKVVWGYQRGFN